MLFGPHLGKWRDGEIKDKGGSSDESPRYLVSPPSICPNSGLISESEADS